MLYAFRRSKRGKELDNSLKLIDGDFKLWVISSHVRPHGGSVLRFNLGLLDWKALSKDRKGRWVSAKFFWEGISMKVFSPYAPNEVKHKTRLWDTFKLMSSSIVASDFNMVEKHRETL